jgi:hypothetical protein
MTARPRYSSRIAVCVCGWLLAGPVSWANDLPGVSGLVRGNQAVELPGIGRVVLSFLLVVAIGVGALIVLRRWQPVWSKPRVGTGLIQVLERSRVGDVRVYLLSVDGQKVLITEHRSGTSAVVLDPVPAFVDPPQS